MSKVKFYNKYASLRNLRLCVHFKESDKETREHSPHNAMYVYYGDYIPLTYETTLAEGDGYGFL